jgi:iron complex transport system substrate-binding protein
MRPALKKLAPIILAALSTAALAFPASSQTAVSFTDAAGRPIVLEKLPQRLAVVGRGPQYLLHLLYMFPEGPSRLIGLEQRGRTASDFLSAVAPDIDRKIPLLPNPGPETIAALHPDLVLVKGNGPDPLAEALFKVGIQTAALSLETPDEYYRDITNLGLILGNPKRAAEIVDFYKRGVGRVETALAGLRDADKPSVLVVMGNIRSGKYAVRVPARPWMQTYQVEAGGGRPVWLSAAEQAGGWAVVNLEQIAAWDPDRLVIIVWYSTNAAAFMGWLGADPQWKLIRAVKEGKVSYFPSDFYGWDAPDARWILGLTWTAATLHPDLLKDYNIEDEVYRFYTGLYGLDRETVKTKVLPLLKTDFR